MITSCASTDEKSCASIDKKNRQSVNISISKHVSVAPFGFRWPQTHWHIEPRQNGYHFADDMFKCIFLIENVRISINISMKFVPKVQINNIPALVPIMAWRPLGDKSFSEPIMVSLLTHICATRHQWINQPHVRTSLLYIFVVVGLMLFVPSYSATCFMYITGKLFLFPLLLCSLWCAQVIGYIMARMSYSAVYTLHYLTIITMQTYPKALNIWNFPILSSVCLRLRHFLIYRWCPFLLWWLWIHLILLTSSSSRK